MYSKTHGSQTDIARLRAELFRGQLDDSMMLALLDISGATLSRYIKAGLPHYRLGRRRLFDVEATRSWVLSHQTKNGPARGRGRPRKQSA